MNIPKKLEIETQKIYFGVSLLIGVAIFFGKLLILNDYLSFQGSEFRLAQISELAR